MGIREEINKRQKSSAAIILVAAVLAVGLSIWSQSDSIRRVNKAFYSDEAGNGIFVDDIDRVYPFDHNGTKAYRAYVYKDKAGKPFVSYIARYNDSARARLESLLQKKSDASLQGDIAQARGTGIEVKKPGTGGNWVGIQSTHGAELTGHPILPDGSTAQMASP